MHHSFLYISLPLLRSFLPCVMPTFFMLSQQALLCFAPLRSKRNTSAEEHQTKARRAEKIWGGDCPPPHLRVYMSAPFLSQGLDPALLCNCGEEGGTKEPPRRATCQFLYSLEEVTVRASVHVRLKCSLATALHNEW